MIKFSSLLTEALEWKDIPEEEKQQAYELIDAHNKKSDDTIKGYYAIDVTGKHQAYYTFWRYKDIPPEFAWVIKNPIYMGNLSTDFLNSVKKAIDKAPPTVKIIIDAEGTKHHLIGKQEVFTFGKYRGEPFYEVYLKDPGYFAFLAKNQDPRYANTKTSQIVQFFANLYFEEVTKKNIETSKSQYVGNVKDKYEGELLVYKIDEKEGTDFSTGNPKKYRVYKLIDDKENKFLSIDLERSFPNVKQGDKIKLKAKLKGQKEILGIKFNLLNYVKPLGTISPPPSPETPPPTI